MNSPYYKAIDLLKELIKTPSLSGEEEGTAMLIAQWLDHFKIPTERMHNNIWALNKYYDATKPTILLNSHHDTVKPNPGYTRNPYDAYEENDKLYGLGSNDAGGPLVSLLAAFVNFYDRPAMRYNLLIAATAEEENSGPGGIEALLPQLPPLAFALVGEPTAMHMAIAEKGLLVIDGEAQGVAGHAAHDHTVNALYKAVEDIQKIRNYRFDKVSELLGPVKMSVTQIQAGEQHNVVPATCQFVIDVRVNECYTNKEVFAILDNLTESKLKARSFRLNSSGIASDHPIVRAGLDLGLKTFGSPTLSDQALLQCPSLKMGPGDTFRSHQADEYIGLNEIAQGIDIYIKLLNQIL